MKILLIEDDEALATFLKQALEQHHYQVDAAQDGQTGLELAKAFEYDLIVLDWYLPGLNGIDICRKLRQPSVPATVNSSTPIILLTAKDSRDSKIVGLDAGADDYVVKPFDLAELLARIRALFRRGNHLGRSPVLQWGTVTLNPKSCEVICNEQPVHLTVKEYSLLELFLRNPQRIFSQAALLDQLWSFDAPPSENAVRTQIKGLRQKLKQVGGEDLLETVYGMGYRLRTPGESRRELGETNRQESPPAPVLSSTATVAPQFAAIWQKHVPQYRDRLATIERAIAALDNHTLTTELHQTALTQAHTLAGSLGSFGLDDGSHLARCLEQALLSLTDRQADPVLVYQLKDWADALQAILQNAPGHPAPPVQEQSPSTVVAQAAAPDINRTYRPPLLEPTGPPLFPALTGQLLIVTHDLDLLKAITIAAIAQGMEVSTASTVAQARTAIAQQRPNVVLLDLTFDTTDTGFLLLSELTQAEHPIPTLVVTGQEHLADRVQVARLGGSGFLHKSMPPSHVMKAIAQVLQHASVMEATIMVVDDDLGVLNTLHTLLAPWGFQVVLLQDSKQFWELLQHVQPDLLILDIVMPEVSGIDLCQVVRNDPNWSEIPILVLSAHRDAQTITQVFTAGADDYISKPVIGPELLARVLNRLERTYIHRRWPFAQTKPLSAI